MLFGYHRVSTKEQHLDRGVTEIREYCKTNGLTISKMYTDKTTGKTYDRVAYQNLRKRVKGGDTLIITELDRLGRNRDQILRELQYLRNKKVRVMILELPTTLISFTEIDDSLAKMMYETINNMMLELFASMCEAEMKKREKRQREGIAAMKKRGEWDRYGRKRKMSITKFERLYEEVRGGRTPVKQFRETHDLSSTTYYRYIQELKQKKNS